MGPGAPAIPLGIHFLVLELGGLENPAIQRARNLGFHPIFGRPARPQ